MSDRQRSCRGSTSCSDLRSRLTDAPTGWNCCGPTFGTPLDAWRPHMGVHGIRVEPADMAVGLSRLLDWRPSQTTLSWS
ncbi:hypothetical protein HBB16_02340 [Pseudonocardia sp. MCCB 268]|nr:hypothetical protein [Pseudonocardia cytotoxica]